MSDKCGLQQKNYIVPFLNKICEHLARVCRIIYLLLSYILYIVGYNIRYINFLFSAQPMSDALKEAK